MMRTREMLEKVQQLKEDCILNGFERTDDVDQFLLENWMQILDILDDVLYVYLNKYDTDCTE